MTVSRGFLGFFLTASAVILRLRCCLRVWLKGVYGCRSKLNEREARLLEEAVPGPGGSFRVHNFQQPAAVLSAAKGAPLRLRGTT